MIILTKAQWETMISALHGAYPEEGCGLVIGHQQGGDWVVDDIVPSENLSPTPLRNFEVDMRLRLRLQRELRDTGRAVIGHYHSHPDGVATPSATDLKSAWEDNMVWIIVAIAPNQESLSAHCYAASTNKFSVVDIQIPD
jgi:desampylase